VDIDTISRTINDALTAAGLDTKTGPLKGVTATIDRALASAGLAQFDRPLPGNPSRAFRARDPMPPGVSARADSTITDIGQFLSLSHSSGRGSRAYKLYVPSSYDGDPAPLIVMLHGCKQNPEDFAAGTRMNALAEKDGFLVAYPAQTMRDNGSNCWNWFDANQQSREGIEPSLISGIVSDIRKSHAVDSSRIFVAGLSAGAAMAVILGTTHPEVFAAVGAHSGLPVGVAHDVPSAFAAMGGRAAASTRVSVGKPAVPTIVFHGDADHTVAMANGNTIVDQATQAYADSDTTLHKRPTESPDDKRFSMTAYEDANGRRRVEQWIVHGGAHAWFGGSPAGSYTDPSGPDASTEMVRFFLGQAPKTN